MRSNRSLTAPIAVLGFTLLLLGLPRLDVDGAQQRHKRRPEPPPKTSVGPMCLSITSDKPALVQGEHCTLTAAVEDPSGKPIPEPYWSATGGTIEGKGLSVRYIAPTDQTGVFLITVAIPIPGSDVPSMCSISLAVTSPPGGSQVTRRRPTSGCTGARATETWASASGLARAR
jgi:hypothetical protein